MFQGSQQYLWGEVVEVVCHCWDGPLIMPGSLLLHLLLCSGKNAVSLVLITSKSLGDFWSIEQVICALLPQKMQNLGVTVYQKLLCSTSGTGPNDASNTVVTWTLMQPSMGTLNSPSSRIVKDCLDVESWDAVYKLRDWWILTHFIFGHGEFSLNNIWSMVNLERTCVLLFSLFKSESWPRK